MKKVVLLLLLVFLSACTSNTIFDEPKDLIPKDSMTLMIQDLLIASTTRTIKNKNGEKNINYMPLVKEKYKIDSTRFAESNLYYTSKIDLYLTILEDAKDSIKKKRDHLKRFQQIRDSLRIDSLKLRQDFLLDSVSMLKDTIKRDSLKAIFKKEKLRLNEELNEELIGDDY
ncbi:DUF4296 domain-containing protein [Polaribacter sp.]|nr:DUF4296 domain-containing protein [Polaribacter sp.]